MRIFAAGIATETNTFSPLPTALEDFLVQRGSAPVLYPSLNLADVWGKQAIAPHDELVFSLNAWAEPAAITLVRQQSAIPAASIHDRLAPRGHCGGAAHCARTSSS